MAVHHYKREFFPKAKKWFFICERCPSVLDENGNELEGEKE